jgi:acetyltransferase-like isoleucine patch superfamily enzyme
MISVLKRARRLCKLTFNRVFILYLKLHSVKVDWSTTVDPTASLEPSDGSIHIGASTYIDRGVVIRGLGGKIVVGNNCSINAYTVLIGGGPISIHSNVRIAPHVVIVASNHVFKDPNRLIKDQGLTCKGIVIHDDVWIGAGSQILDGVTIGRGAVIGAGSVVNKSVHPLAVVAGVPAKEITRRQSLGF